MTVSLPWARWPGVLAYVALAMFVNTTVIRIADGALVVRHGPIPWPGRRLSAASVTGVEVRSRSSADMTTTTHWELVALQRDGRAVRLMWGPIAGHRHDLLDDAARTLNGGSSGS